MGLLQDAASWLSDLQTADAGISITYTRAGLGTATVTARRGRTAFRLGEEGGGTRLEFSDADFIVKTASLVVGGETITPRRGDQIVAGGVTYQVQAPPGEQPARHADELGVDWRIHCKRVSN